MTKPKGPSRLPRGVLSSKPIYMRLMPSERSTLEQLSAVQNRSTSSVARLVFLEGIERYRAKVIGASAQSHSKPLADH
jgi:hypothetical protein